MGHRSVVGHDLGDADVGELVAGAANALVILGDVLVSRRDPPAASGVDQLSLSGYATILAAAALLGVGPAGEGFVGEDRGSE